VDDQKQSNQKLFHCVYLCCGSTTQLSAKLINTNMKHAEEDNL